MSSIDARLHRTWIQALLEAGHHEISALLVDADLQEEWRGHSPVVAIHLPSSSYLLVQNDSNVRQIIQRSLNLIGRGHISDQDGNDMAEIPIAYRVKLLDVEDDWRSVVRNLIVNAKDPNQGVITEKVFERQQRQPYLYNEMKFASQSEIRIAQELEQRKVLFFPLPLAVRSETGTLYKDHREIDFLVCENGVWGIIEVSYHPNRFEQDAEKDIWFKKSGVLCIQHYTAERCYSRPGEVVNEFLEVLAKHRR
jgi:hypothetical protein